MKFRRILVAIGALCMVGALSGCFCFDGPRGGGHRHCR